MFREEIERCPGVESERCSGRRVRGVLEWRVRGAQGGTPEIREIMNNDNIVG